MIIFRHYYYFSFSWFCKCDTSYTVHCIYFSIICPIWAARHISVLSYNQEIMADGQTFSDISMWYPIRWKLQCSEISQNKALEKTQFLYQVPYGSIAFLQYEVLSELQYIVAFWSICGSLCGSSLISYQLCEKRPVIKRWRKRWMKIGKHHSWKNAGHLRHGGN